ncbi:MAG: Holliday junction resolvase RuvX [Betaproteobacteria bacterium]
MPEAGAAASALATLSDSAIVLAFDFGTRRIGVAVGNALTGAARPLSTLEATTKMQRWAGIERLVAEWEPALMVVGIPRHPDGAAHEMTAQCERFARQLEGRTGLTVARVDERYSSAVVADRDDIDAAAAAVILQQWFDQRS